MTVLKRCSTCAFWRMSDRDMRIGTCNAPLPDSVLKGDKTMMFFDNGENCQLFVRSPAPVSPDERVSQAIKNWPEWLRRMYSFTPPAAPPKTDLPLYLHGQEDH